MTERLGKALVAAQALLLLAPATLATAFIVFVSYPAYPPRQWSAPQLAFDLALLAVIAGLIAAWRMAAAYLRAGPGKRRRVHGAWLAIAALGAALGLAGAAVGVAHFFGPLDAGVVAGFALLAPGAALAPLAVHLALARS